MFRLPIGRNIFSWAVSELQPVDPTNRKAINLGLFFANSVCTFWLLDFVFVPVCGVNSSSNIFMSIPLKLLTLLLEMIISARLLFPRPPPSAQIPT